MFFCSCTAKYIEITPKNNLIDLPSYSFMVPIDNDIVWDLTLIRHERELAEIKSYYQDYGCGVSLLYEKFDNKYNNREQAISDYRKTIGNAIKDSGLCVIQDLNNEIFTLNKNEFYNVFSYKIEGADGKTRQCTLFLYFPYSDNDNRFICVMYDEYYITKKGNCRDCFSSFTSLLKTIKLKEDIPNNSN